MPFIITTYDRREVYGTPRAVVVKARIAVAGLDEAQDAVIAAIPVPPDGWAPEALSVANTVTESGGTVGPLPDGTVIEVESVEWSALVAPAGGIARNRRDLIDAYNAAQKASS